MNGWKPFQAVDLYKKHLEIDSLVVFMLTSYGLTVATHLILFKVTKKGGAPLH